MNNLIDEIIDLTPKKFQGDECASCHKGESNCNCSKCQKKRISKSLKFHPFGCKCSQCRQRNLEISGEEAGESWLDSLVDWGSGIVSSFSGNITYPVTQGESYGSKWKNNLPPGLPSWARMASSKEAAIPHVMEEAKKYGLGDLFIKAVTQMAKTESKGRFALPANNFNSNPPHLRSGKPLITAWGVFQFNRDAWTSIVPESERNTYKSFKREGDSGCGSNAGCVYPWDCTSKEEISRPIKKYAELFQDIKNAGGSDVDGAIGLRLWHIAPVGWYKPWFENGKIRGFRKAWDGLTSNQKSRINSFLKNARVDSDLTSEVTGLLENEYLDSIISSATNLFSKLKIEDRTSFSPKSKRIKERDINSVYALVLHQMGFDRGNKPEKYDSVTAHFVILRDGKIYQLHPLSSYLYSSNGFNKGSVAVEFAGNFKSVRGRCYKPEQFGCHSLTTDQIQSGRFLIKYLIDKIGLTHVLAHRQSSGSRGNDPGPEIWANIGQWAIENLNLNDGGEGFKVGSGMPVPKEWKKTSPTSSEIYSDNILSEVLGLSLREKVVRIALEERDKWNNGRLKETSSRAIPILQDYYDFGIGQRISSRNLQNSNWQQENPWSAVFISWVMKKAGAKEQFNYASAHWRYIAAAKKNRLENKTENQFWAYRINEVKPDLGDIVCRTRNNSRLTYDNIERGGFTHGDIVVKVNKDHLIVVGGNVDNSVKEKIVKLNSEGYVNQKDYFAIVKIHDGSFSSWIKDIW